MIRRLLALIVLVFAATAFDCGKGSNPRPTGSGQGYYVQSGKGWTDSDDDIHTTLSAAIGVPNDRSDFKFGGTTPQGARYRSTVAVPQPFLNAIDEGLAAQIARYNAVYPSWQNYDRIEDYDILIIDGNCHNVETAPGSPAMCFGDGLQTAGTNIGNAGVPKVKKPYIVLPQQTFTLEDLPTGRVRHEIADKWGYLDYWRNSVTAEAEHIRESSNDYRVFLNFAIAGDAHPHQIPVAVE